MFFNESAELATRCDKRSAAAAHNAILFTVFRIDDLWRVANSTSKFLTHDSVREVGHPPYVCSAQRLKAKIVPAAAKIASNNRLAGTAEDNKAIVAGTLALFGTYSVDEAKKTLTFNIEASTFPNAEGTVQTRTIDLLNADEFRNSNPGASRDGPVVAMNVYRRAK
jgi:hypothetical protein